MLIIQTATDTSSCPWALGAMIAEGTCPSITIQASRGPEEIRTPDPLAASQVLYQLSYGPIGTGAMLAAAPEGPQGPHQDAAGSRSQSTTGASAQRVSRR
jgi:hypothetical protein